MKDKTRRAAIYVRVSTGSQTVENQLRELRAVADRHAGMSSGSSATKGLAAQRVATSARALIACCKPSRAARSI